MRIAGAINVYTPTIEAAKKKTSCPHCGSKNFKLMPTDFETAKCSDCKKNFDINAGGPGSGRKPGFGFGPTPSAKAYKASTAAHALSDKAFKSGSMADHRAAFMAHKTAGALVRDAASRSKDADEKYYLRSTAAEHTASAGDHRFAMQELRDPNGVRYPG